MELFISIHISYYLQDKKDKKDKQDLQDHQDHKVIGYNTYSIKATECNNSEVSSEI